MIMLWLLLGALGFFFFFVVLRGAPYVPTHRHAVEKALDLLDLPRGSRLIDLGSGDGVFLKAAAERGYYVTGYEINPFLCAISYIRCWKYRDRVTVRWRDFWLTGMPKDIDAVFVFLAGPYLKQLHKKLEAERNGRPLKVVSYGFLIPGAGKPAKVADAVNLYFYK